MKLLSLILVIMMSNYIFCLKINNFCYMKQKQCNIVYDFIKGYKIQCVKAKCHGEYSYRCGYDLCASDEPKCKTFQQLKQENNSNMDPISLYSRSIRIVDYKHLTQNIPDCPQEKDIKKPFSEQICENGKECEVVQVFALRFGIWRQSRPIDCPCIDAFPYKCSNYCALNQFACNRFRLSKNNSNVELNSIQNCKNSHLVVHRYL